MDGPVIERIKKEWPDLDYSTIQVSKHHEEARLRDEGWYLVGEVSDALEGDGTVLVWSNTPTSETFKPVSDKNPHAKERP